MSKNLLIISFGLFVMFFSADVSAQTWKKLASVPGNGNDGDGPASFVIDGKIYSGGGFYSKAFYEYDPGTDKWTVKAEIPGTTNSRMSASGFSVNGKGYIVCGSDIDPTTFKAAETKDLWEYDPAADKWTKKADIPGVARSGTSAFVINNKVYLVGGYAGAGGYLNETLEYNPATDKWTSKADFLLDNINGASGFAINGKGYVALGNTKTGSMPTAYNNTLYEYNPTTDKWAKKADFPGTGRSRAVSFVLGKTGFVGQGSSLNGSQYVYHNDFYTYDPATDSWGTAITNFPALPRQSLVAQVVADKAYIGMGWTFLSGNNAYYRDWYEFSHPLNISTNMHTGDIHCYPNPTSGMLHIDAGSYKGTVEYKVLSVTGQQLLQGSAHNNTINCDKLAAGQYILQLSTNSNSARQLITIL